MKQISSWGLMLLLATLATPAAAQEIPCPRGPCVQKRREGTHFLAEVYGGGTLNRDGGLAVDGIFGVGGKLPFLPLRFYLVTELGYSTSMGSGTLLGSPLAYRDERDYKDIALGLRVYVPMLAGLRLFADVLGGGSYQSVVFERESLPTLDLDAWSPLLVAAGGIQYRIFHHLSLGARARFVFTDPDLAGFYAAMGQSTPCRTSLTAGLTWHF